MSVRFRPPGPALVVSTTIVLQLAAAWLLGSVASRFPHVGLILAVAAVAAAIVLNLFRFALWGYAHRHYPLSHIYPLTALFFPCVVILSWWHGDAIGSREVAGTLLITLGALVLGMKIRGKGQAHG